MKLRTQAIVAGVCGALLAFAGVAGADALGTWEYSHSSSVVGTAQGIVFTFGWWNPNEGAVISDPVFEEIFVTCSDVGMSFTATGADDPDFDGLVSVLTNGVDDTLAVMHTVGSCGCGSGIHMRESQVFVNGSPDFAGQAIDSICLKVNSLLLDPQESWTDYSFDVAVVVVPEPAALSLLAVGACTFLLRATKRAPICRP
jgi:hypothetical protein